MQSSVTPPHSESPAPQRAIGIAFAAFLLTRLAVLLFTPHLFSDVGLYATYAVRTIDRQETPYSDFTVEYPPVSFWLTLPPRWMTKESPASPGFLATYRFTFRIEMFLLDVLGCLFFAKAVQAGRATLAAPAIWGYTLTGVLLAPVLYDRLDAALLLLLMFWIWAGEEARRADRPLRYWLYACVALGLSIAHKLVPLVAVPFFGISLLCRTRSIGSVAACVVTLLAATAVPFALHWAVSGNDIWWLLSFHAQRGLEVESVYAGFLMVLQEATQAFAFQGPGSWDVGGQIATQCAAWATYVIVGLLMILAAATLKKWAKDRDLSLAPAILAIVVATLFAKVLSAQYPIWLLPLLLALGSQLLERKGFLALVFGCLLAAAATTYVFPFNFFQVVNPRTQEIYYPNALIQGTGAQRGFHPVTAWILVIRNLALLVMTAYLGWRLFCKDRGADARAMPAPR